MYNMLEVDLSKRQQLRSCATKSFETERGKKSSWMSIYLGYLTDTVFMVTL